MSDELYTTLTDDALESIVRAQKKLGAAQDMLKRADHPGVRFSNRSAGKIIANLQKAIDDINMLPASLEGK